MAVLVMFDSPARRADAEAITDSMNVRDDPPNGLIFHVITEVPQGVRVYDVWESEADFQQFARERLLPAGRAYSLERTADGCPDVSVDSHRGFRSGPRRQHQSWPEVIQNMRKGKRCGSQDRGVEGELRALQSGGYSGCRESVD